MTRNKIAVAAIAAGLLLVAAGSANAQSKIQFSNMHEFESGDDIAGAGILQRTKNSADFKLALQGLDQDAAYTTWWVVFNNPEECEGIPCGLDDLGTKDASIIWATGFVTGADGTVNVTAHLDARFIPEGTQVLFGPGLKQGNGFDAEIHVIVRTHQGAIAGKTAGQISTVSGECGPAPDFPNCEDQQAIMFLPIP